MRLIADVLGGSDCRIGLEAIGPKTLLDGPRHPFVHTIPGALELLSAIDRPNVGLLLDSFHWFTSHGSVAELSALNASQVVYVHINDAIPGIGIDEQLDGVRLLPGASGVIDLVTFLKVLDGIGYDGPVAVEPFSAELAATPPAERVRLAAESLHASFAAAGLSLKGDAHRADSIRCLAMSHFAAFLSLWERTPNSATSRWVTVSRQLRQSQLLGQPGRWYSHIACLIRRSWMEVRLALRLPSSDSNTRTVPVTTS